MVENAPAAPAIKLEPGETANLLIKGGYVNRLHEMVRWSAVVGGIGPSRFLNTIVIREEKGRLFVLIFPLRYRTLHIIQVLTQGLALLIFK